MQNKNTIIIILLLIIILILGYVAFLKPQNAGQKYSNDYQNTTTNNPPTKLNDMGNIDATTTTNSPQNNIPTNGSNKNLISKSDWGINITKASSWNVTSNTSDKLILTQTAPQGESGDTITITNVFSNTITDTDAKFGNVTYYYDSNTTKFMKSQIEEDTGKLAITPAVATTYTASGLPVFRGTGRWLTYIIPVSHAQFLKLNISGGGYTEPLTDLLKTI